MTDEAAARRQAIDEFASTLSTLRDSVGKPSFRAMAGRSGCISHTTLHEAAQGNRLPTWETTVEFVKACDGDPADYRGAWSAADRVVNPIATAADSPPPAPPGSAAEATDSAGMPPAPVPVPVPAPVDSAARPAGSSTAAPAAFAQTSDDGPSEPVEAPAEQPFGKAPAWQLAAVVTGAAVLVAAGVVAWKVLSDDDKGGAPTGPATTSSSQVAPLIPALPSPTSCPIKSPNPPPKAPANTGDKAMFLGDQTIPDCTVVAPGQEFRKVWRLRNDGTVTWTKRTMQRVELPQGLDDCQTTERIKVPETAPGKEVDIAVRVTAPDQPGYCFVRWSMRDDHDRVAFPGGRPVNFQVVVRR